MSMDIRVGDVLVMKKPHPCGSCRWRVERTGADLRLKCEGCARELLLPRFKAEHNVKRVEQEESFDGLPKNP